MQKTLHSAQRPWKTMHVSSYQHCFHGIWKVYGLLLALPTSSVLLPTSAWFRNLPYCDSQGSTDRFCPISSSSTVHLPQLELWIKGWKWDLKMEKSSIQAKPPWWGYLASWDIFLCIQFSASTKGSVTLQVNHTSLITGVVGEHRSHMTWLCL